MITLEWKWKSIPRRKSRQYRSLGHLKVVGVGRVPTTRTPDDIVITVCKVLRETIYSILRSLVVWVSERKFFYKGLSGKLSNEDRLHRQLLDEREAQEADVVPNVIARS